MVKWIALALLALPALELAAFVAVGLAIGFLSALGLMVLTTIAGMLVLQQAGRTGMAKMRVAMADGGFATIQSGGLDALKVLGGLLLVLPGFITDAIGLALLLPAARRGLFALAGRRMAGARPARSRDRVLDLEPQEWRPVPEPTLPPREPDQPMPAADPTRRP